MNRLKFTEKETWNGTLSNLTSYQMGLQVPPGLNSEIPEERALWPASERAWVNASGVGLAKGE